MTGDMLRGRPIRDLLMEWHSREYHLGAAQPEKWSELERCRKELEDVFCEEVQKWDETDSCPLCGESGVYTNDSADYYDCDNSHCRVSQFHGGSDG